MKELSLSDSCAVEGGFFVPVAAIAVCAVVAVGAVEYLIYTDGYNAGYGG